MGLFFALVKSFDANTAISANFVLTVKHLSDKSSVSISDWKKTH